MTQPAPAAHHAPSAHPLRTKLVIVAALYFASGFPFGIFNELLPTYLRFQGVGLEEIGVVAAALGLSWTFKFLWAPLVDQLGTRRRWITAVQLGMAAVMLLVAALDATSVTPSLWVLLAALTVLSATQDIAIDAYTIELLDEREYGAANGIRVTAYRVALIAAGGLLVILAGTVGWPAVFVVAAVVLLGLAVMSLFIPQRPIARPPATGVAQVVERAVWHPLRGLATLPGFVAVVLFVLTFKLGDLALLPMIRPFWVDRGFSAEMIGFAQGTVGMVATIVGALLGGALTTRWGIFRALWTLGLMQAASNLAYFVAARSAAEPAVIYATVIVEQFTQGLGTAAFLAFLMALCDRRFAATQYALLSALYGLSRSIAAVPSGYLAEDLGYAPYFLITFAMAFPAFALLPWVKRALEKNPNRPEGVPIPL